MENHFTGISARNTAFKGNHSSQIFVTVQRNISAKDNLETLTKET